MPATGMMTGDESAVGSSLQVPGPGPVLEQVAEAVVDIKKGVEGVNRKRPGVKSC